MVQARVMSGDHEPARLVGVLPNKVDGEHVAVVAYLEGGEQEQVPISMLRTLDNTEVREYSRFEPTQAQHFYNCEVGNLRRSCAFKCCKAVSLH